jgi:hypothetical protein
VISRPCLGRASGRYLAPEPLLLSPDILVERAYEGGGAPAYGYAYGNPVAFVDPDGMRGTIPWRAPPPRLGGDLRLPNTGPTLVTPIVPTPNFDDWPEPPVPALDPLSTPLRVPGTGPLTPQVCKDEPAGKCSCQHRDIFKSQGVSCQALRESGVCGGPYRGVGNDTASCQADARSKTSEACRGCLGHCLFRRKN